MLQRVTRRTRWLVLLLGVVVLTGGGWAAVRHRHIAQQELFTQLLGLHQPDILSLGAYAGCAIRDDGRLACWSPPATSHSGFHLDPPPAGTFRHISVGDGAACAIRTDHTLTCWGDVAGPIPGGRFVDVHLSLTGACAIRSTGALVCWDQFGSATTPWRSPAWLPDATGPVRDITRSSRYDCVLQVDAILICGSEDVEAMRMGTPAETFTQVAMGVGASHGCALRSDGVAMCWGGRNDYGETAPPAGTFRQISTGAWHTCALRTDRSLACWGNNRYGQATPPAGRFRAVSASMYETCAITTEGALTCWGSDDGPGPPVEDAPLPSGRFGPPDP